MAINIVNVDGTTYPIYDNRISAVPLTIGQGGTGATTATGAMKNIIGTTTTTANKYLRDDGTWQAVSTSDVNVNQTAYTGTSNVAYPLLLASQKGRGDWVDGSREASVNPYATLNPLNARMFLCPTGLTTTNPGYNLYDTSNSKYYGTFSIEALWASATTPGIGRLTLGNGTATDTEGGVIGQLDLYGSSAYYNRIVASAASSSKVNSIPNANGYLAVGSTSGVGSTTKGVYMSSSGVLTACSYSLGKDVSSSAILTDTYPSGLTWTAGTTAGPVPSISRSGSTTTAVTGSAIPSASASASGIVTTGAQTFAGAKTFNGALYFGGTTSYYLSTAGNIVNNNIHAYGYGQVDSYLTVGATATFNGKLIGKSGTVSTGNYTTTVPSSAGTTGQIMFVLV